jgi:hypothetical protein
MLIENRKHKTRGMRKLSITEMLKTSAGLLIHSNVRKNKNDQKLSLPLFIRPAFLDMSYPQ